MTSSALPRRGTAMVCGRNSGLGTGSEPGTVERHVAEGDTREHENDGAGSYTRGEAPPSTTSELVVCERLD